MQSLVTTRLQLWPCKPDDIDRLHALWCEPGVRRFLWDDEVISRGQAANVVQTFLDSAPARGFGLWTIHTQPAGEFVGFCALREIAPGTEVELLYGLAPRAWGQGFASEAALAVVDYGFRVLRLPRIWGRTDVPNTASVAVLERLGMRPATDPTGESTGLVSYVIECRAAIAR